MATQLEIEMGLRIIDLEADLEAANYQLKQLEQLLNPLMAMIPEHVAGDAVVGINTSNVMPNIPAS